MGKIVYFLIINNRIKIDSLLSFFNFVNVNNYKYEIIYYCKLSESIYIFGRNMNKRM